MLTLPIESSQESGILAIGRSEPVLSETVRILRRKGHTAGASNDFDHALTLSTWLRSISSPSAG